MEQGGELNLFKSRERLASKEIEVKVLNLAPKEEIFKKISSLGAIEVNGEDRLLSDRRYKAVKESTVQGFQPIMVGKSLVLNEAELENLIQVFEYCGFVVERQNNFLRLISQKKGSEKQLALRLRRDGSEKTLFTVKSEMQKKEDYVERDELEVNLKNSSETRKVFRELIENLGFKQKSFIQKHRTTFELEYKGQKVKIEYNVSPLKQVKPWLEVEAENPEHVSEVVKLLGYGQDDLFLGSDAEMYKTIYNIKAKKIKFNPTKDEEKPNQQA